MLLFHPMRLGREAREGRVSKRDARAFARVNVWIAMAIALAGMGAWYWFVVRGATEDVGMEQTRGGEWLRFPMFAATDARVWWLVMAVWVWVTLRVAGGMFQWMLGWMAGKGAVRRRVGRLGWYASGLMPVQVVLLGTMAAAAVLSEKERVIAADWRTALEQVMQTCGLLAWAVMAWVGVMMVVGTGRRVVVRGFVIAVVYPVMAWVVGVALLALVMWVMGWVAMMAWSMGG